MVKFRVKIVEMLSCAYGKNLNIDTEKHCLLRFFCLNIKNFTVCAVNHSKDNYTTLNHADFLS